MNHHELNCLYLSQEDLLESGCLDFKMSVEAAEKGLLAFQNDEVLFPEKIVQIFNTETQERINCLPATFLKNKICGMKWVSVFPPNPVKYGLQNLSAVILLSEIERGFPLAFMEGTLCSNMRVGTMGAIAAKYLAIPDSESIGFIGAGEQAKMHLIAMKSQIPSLRECRIAAKTEEEEKQFIKELSPLFSDIKFISTQANLQASVEGADIVVTATSVQAPLLKAAWLKPGVFYSHVGGWEDEYEVALSCNKIICDDWETVKHRTQTLSRMYKDKKLTDDDIYANLIDLVNGKKKGRENNEEKIYFNAVGLAYIDIAIAIAMYQKALSANKGQALSLQKQMIFEHPNLKDYLQN